MATNFLKLMLGGTLPGGEVWSVNPCWAPSGGTMADPSPEALNAVADGIRDLTVPAALRSLLSTAGAQTRFRVEARAFGGTLNSVGENANTTPMFGQGSATKPFQCAVVVSLRTAFAGGRRRGRLYWPAIGATNSSTTLRLTTPAIETVGTAMKTYLADIEDVINTELGGGLFLAVVSETGGFVTPVNRLQVGDILDVQRRRRDKAPETYYSTDF